MPAKDITKQAWTPGPWEIQRIINDYAIFGQSDFDKPQIATVAGELWGSKLPVEANAKLIAKAPEMAEFLLKLLKSEFYIPSESVLRAEAERILREAGAI